MNTPLEIIAVASVVKDAELKQCKSKIAPGVYNVSASVKVEGTINVSEPFEVAQTLKALGLTDIAFALLRNGFNAENSARIICETALRSDGEDLKQDARVLRVIGLVKDRMSQLPKREQVKFTTALKLSDLNETTTIEVVDKDKVVQNV
jgi:hypothetical protein